ncbi:MAG: hypothetical protein KKC85_01280 [Gammaproteobacteria bacterium]|nr:hypothetical protein [Gammaproteobacteria bacterium]MBU1443122.1 hypothetical protein [Gammaproteobacteria bacterium]MBU2285049.1 hypothetical protein [Gammaproteobacteria bacterium]
MKHTTILSALALSCSLCAASAAFAKLPVPAPTPEAKAKAAETAAKAAWSDKVATYQLCQSQDRAAAAYRAKATQEGKTPTTPTATPPCSDPGPYAAVAAPTEQKPIEASGAHSPAATATSPPSENKPAAETAPAAPKQ